MKLIAIETATENCAVAVMNGYEIIQKQLIEPRKHAELVLPFLDELLRQSGMPKSAIQGIVFGHGPGAFTGVRVAIGIVQGLALALNIPVLGVSTMHNMAQGAWRQGKRGQLMVVNDARMNELYVASFELTDQGIKRKSEDLLMSPNQIDFDQSDWVVGNGLLTYPHLSEQISGQIDDNALPDAHNLLSWGAPHFEQMAYQAHQIKPNYVRNQVIRT